MSEKSSSKIIGLDGLIKESGQKSSGNKTVSSAGGGRAYHSRAGSVKVGTVKKSAKIVGKGAKKSSPKGKGGGRRP